MLKSLKQYLINERLRLYEVKSEIDDKVVSGTALSPEEHELYLETCAKLDVINDIYVICGNRKRY